MAIAKDREQAGLGSQAGTLKYSQEHSGASMMGEDMTDEIDEMAFHDIPRRRLLKPVEVAAFLGVSAKTVYRWCDMGLMESVKLNRSVRVLRASVLTFLSCSRNEGIE